MDPGIKVDSLEKEIGHMVLTGLKKYADIDLNVDIHDEKIKSEMQFKVYNQFIDKLQDAIIQYDGELSELLPYITRFFL